MNIYIYGIIGSDVLLSDVINKINTNKEDNEIDLRIHSPGGSIREGFAIYDFLKNSGKKINTYVDGLCASMATVLALLGEKRYMTKNAEYFIHMPMAEMTGYYNADELDKYKLELDKEENKILSVYSTVTGKDIEVLRNAMKSEISLNMEQAIELGFVTDVIEPMKAVAFFNIENNKNKENMEKETNNLNKMLDKIWNFLTGDNKINLKIADADGKELDINTEEMEYKVGDEVSIDGKPAADGEYIIPSTKDTIIIKEGKIIEIKKEEELAKEEIKQEVKVEDKKENESLNIAKLKEENEALLKRVDELELKMIEYKNIIGEVTQKVENTFNKIASTYKPPVRMQNFREKIGQVVESDELKLMKSSSFKTKIKY